MVPNFLSVYFPSVNLPNKITSFLSYCIFQDMTTGRRIGSSHEREGMYYLDNKVSSVGLIANQSDSILLWQWCLGHPSLQKLRFVIPVESSISILGCESCKLGKHHCVSFQS